MEFKLKLKSQTATLDDIDPQTGVMMGYLSNWDNKDSDGDFTIKGKTFVRTIAKNGPTGSGELRYLVNHNWDNVAGVFTNISEDAKGLRYEAQLTKSRNGVFTPRSEELIALYDTGFKYNHSYGYQVADQQKMANGNALLDVEMHEGSILTMPGANRLTPVVGMKSHFGNDEDYINNLIDTRANLQKACHRGNLQDETYLRFQNTIAAIDLALKSLTEATPVVTQNPLDVQTKANNDALITAFSKGLFTNN